MTSASDNDKGGEIEKSMLNNPGWFYLLENHIDLHGLQTESPSGTVWDVSNSTWSSSTPKLQVELAPSEVRVGEMKCLADNSKNNLHHILMTCGDTLSTSQLSILPFSFFLSLFNSTWRSATDGASQEGLRRREACGARQRDAVAGGEIDNGGDGDVAADGKVGEKKRLAETVLAPLCGACALNLLQPPAPTAVAGSSRTGRGISSCVLRINRPSPEGRTTWDLTGE